MSEDQRMVDSSFEGLCVEVERARAKMHGLARRNVFLEERRRVQDAALRQALTVLEAVQDAATDKEGDTCCCPSCTEPLRWWTGKPLDPPGKHAPDCALATALKAAREALGTPPP